MSEPDLGTAFASLPIAALVIDPAGHVRHANDAAEQLTFRSERAMAGMPLNALLPVASGYPVDDQGISIFDAEFEDARGQSFRADLVSGPIGGHSDWRVVTLTPVPAFRGVAAGNARAAVGAAAMLAHEIRNPLAGIRGAAQLLAGADENDGVLTDLITTEVDRIAALIDQMQDFTDTRPLPLAADNVHPILNHVRRVAQAGFAGGIVIEEAFDPSLPFAHLNRDALVQILLNLVRNATEAGATRIRLASAYRHGLTLAGPEGGARVPVGIELSVADDGPGVPDEIARHMFDPFVSSRPEGRGLGLALVEKLVGQMGGVVRHAREAGWTVFRVFLSRADA